MRISVLPKADTQELTPNGLPKEVEAWLAEHLAGEEVQVVQYADLHGPGHFGDAWVVATQASVLAVRWDADGLKLQARVPLEEVERILIARTLERFGGHRARTARALGIGLRTLTMKIRKWGLKTDRGGRVTAASGSERIERCRTA